MDDDLAPTEVHVAPAQRDELAAGRCTQRRAPSPRLGCLRLREPPLRLRSPRARVGRDGNRRGRRALRARGPAPAPHGPWRCLPAVTPEVAGSSPVAPVPRRCPAKPGHFAFLGRSSRRRPQSGRALPPPNRAPPETAAAGENHHRRRSRCARPAGVPAEKPATFRNSIRERRRAVYAARTSNSVSVTGPNEVSSATSTASRPRPTTTRPTRRRLLRASKVCHAPSR